MPKPHGLLLIDKPKGPTSHDVIDRIRQASGIKKVGHTGTLDPSAQGLLLVLVGRQATKKQNQFQGMDKQYKAAIRLGVKTDTYDSEGSIQQVYNGRMPSKSKIEKVLKKFKGTFKQMPPAYSAKKINGKKAYELAREGKKPDLQPAEISIYKIKFLTYDSPILKIKVDCSKGTYIRSLASDIGQKLGCGAYLAALKRTKIGNFSLENAVSLNKINTKNWRNFLIAP